jgi:glycosyltransferase involved in cell wall biosynthesis
MNIFINCSNLRFGGGITVGFNIIKYYQDNFPSDKIFLIAPANCGYEQFKRNNIELIILPPKYNRSLPKLFLNYFLLPGYIKKFQVDCIISLGNIAVPVHKPQILLIMFPYIAYPESEVWKRLGRFMKFKKNSIVRAIKTNVKYADVIFVQTQTMKQRLSKQLPLMKDKLKVIPCAVSFTSKINPDINQPTINKTRIVKLLFLSKYYVHKNFEILIPVAKKIIERNLDINITITINEKENEGSAQFIKKIEDNNVGQIIKNAGNIKLEDVANMYNAHDGLILPTLLESFSGTYIESFYFGKPIFTSDIDFAHDSCKDAAFFFDPLDANNILETIVNAFNNPASIKNKIDLGKEYLNEYKTWDDIGKIFKQEMNSIIESK